MANKSNYAHYIVNQILPRSVILTYMPKDDSIIKDSGYKDGPVAQAYYSFPKPLAEASMNIKIAAKESTNPFAGILVWYNNYATMPLDVNIKLALVHALRTSDQLPDLESKASVLSLRDRLTLAGAFMRAIASSILVIPAIIVIELLAPFYYSIAEPIYWLGIKPLVKPEAKMTVAELDKINDVRNNYAQNVLIKGLALPAYRLLRKFVLYPLIELPPGVAIGIVDTYKAAGIPKRYNEEQDKRMQADVHYRTNMRYATTQERSNSMSVLLEQFSKIRAEIPAAAERNKLYKRVQTAIVYFAKLDPNKQIRRNALDNITSTLIELYQNRNPAMPPQTTPLDVNIIAALTLIDGNANLRDLISRVVRKKLDEELKRDTDVIRRRNSSYFPSGASGQASSPSSRAASRAASRAPTPTSPVAPASSQEATQPPSDDDKPKDDKLGLT